ncbi:MAG: L-threonylcarbamoyladenylate synthase [Candidatus Shapirobacteria bacterium]|jgi:L-threonylcarbamoyladenylate synthase
MEIIKINDSYEEIIKRTAETIRGGGLVIFPSDTVYILAMDPTNVDATKKLLAFKNRWVGKAISVAVADTKMAKDYVELSENAENIYANLLPGPFTVVSKGKHKMASGIEAENGTLGIRIPDNKYIHDLVTAIGKPVTATSANLSGRTPHYSIESFLKTLSQKKRDMIDLIVDAGKLRFNKPSTVIDATEPEIKILRRGDLITANSKTLISKSEKETGKIAEFILNKSLNQNLPLSPPLTKGGALPLVFGLSGDLGCGKTVFSRSVGKILGVKEKITSPTFVIMNEYDISLKVQKSESLKVGQPVSLKVQKSESLKAGKFLHFDLYRIGGQFELEEIKFWEQFKPGTVACIEWPENMGKENFEKLKKMTNYKAINFEYVNERTRKISYEM